MNNVLHASTPFTNDVLVYHKKRHRYQNNYCICKQFRTHRYTFLSCRPPNQNHQIAYHTLIRHLMNGPLKQVMVANLRDHKQNSTHNKSECEALKRLQHQTLQDNVPLTTQEQVYLQNSTFKMISSITTSIQQWKAVRILMQQEDLFLKRTM